MAEGELLEESSPTLLTQAGVPRSTDILSSSRDDPRRVRLTDHYMRRESSLGFIAAMVLLIGRARRVVTSQDQPPAPAG